MTADDRLSSTTLLALLPDRPSIPFSSLPEWTWGLTQQYKTNNTSARPSLFLATRQLPFHLTVASIVSDSASSLLPLRSPTVLLDSCEFYLNALSYLISEVEYILWKAITCPIHTVLHGDLQWFLNYTWTSMFFYTIIYIAIICRHFTGYFIKALCCVTSGAAIKLAMVTKQKSETLDAKWRGEPRHMSVIVFLTACKLSVSSSLFCDSECLSFMGL